MIVNFFEDTCFLASLIILPLFLTLTDTSENEPKCGVNFRLGAESYSMTHTRRLDAVEIRVDTLAQIRLSTSFESSLVSVKVINEQQNVDHINL